MRLALIAFLGVLMQPVQTSTVGVASLLGIVVDLRSNDPVGKVQVTLTKQSGGNPSTHLVETTEDGTFGFPNMEVGAYRIEARRNGYVRREWTITLSPGRQINDVSLGLMKAGVIYGRITDSAGRPVESAEVCAEESYYQNGRPRLRTVQSAVTNDLGEYRIFGLSPGRYYVNALLPDPKRITCGSPLFASPDFPGIGKTLGQRSVGRSESEIPMPFYFPGTIDLGLSSPIELHSEDSVGGINITVGSVRARRISGVVTGSSTLPSQIGLIPLGTAFDGGVYSFPVNPITGSFEIPAVAPGTYLLAASSAGMAERLSLEIGSEDLEGVRVQLVPSLSVSGRVLSESDSALAVSSVQISLRTDSAISLRSSGVTSPPALGAFGTVTLIKSDGSFTLQAIPGDYQLGISTLPKNAYVKAIRLGSEDLIDGRLHLEDHTNARIELVIGTMPGAITGIVVDRNGKLVADATVAVFPYAPGRQRASSYKQSVTDAFGRFQMDGMAPGDYRAFAWEYLGVGASLDDPELVRRTEGRGTTIRIGEGTNDLVKLTAIAPKF